MSFAREKTVVWTVLVTAALWFAARAVFARPASPASTHKKATSDKPAATKPRSAKAPSKRASGRRHRSRHVPFRYRLAQLHMEPGRVEEIQKALIREGFLNQEPTGKWDDATKDAMRRYQASNGFDSTGLPDAKSLMKLGLGPHALPEEADPTARSRASVESSDKPNNPPSPSPENPASPGGPPNKKP